MNDCEKCAELKRQRDLAIQLALTFRRKVTPMALTESSYDEYDRAKSELEQLRKEIA